jgi:hypothetical protein
MFYCFNQKEGLIPRSLLRGVSFLRWLWKAKLPFLFGKLKCDELNQEANNGKKKTENIAL